MSKPFESKTAAANYGPARNLSSETLSMWMDTLRAMMPVKRVSAIVDLGAGTGRFSQALGEAFEAPVIAVEPSEAMLEEGRKAAYDGVQWRLGHAEAIPVDAASIGLVWMSQVFHHLDSPETAFREIRRILVPGGVLALRNGTTENDAEILWNKFFPDAHTPVPSRQEAVDVITGYGFEFVAMKTLWQLFVASYDEYYERVRQRGLSALIRLDDAAFEDGLKALKQWVDVQPAGVPVYEPMDLFVFRRAGAIALDKVNEVDR